MKSCSILQFPQAKHLGLSFSTHSRIFFSPQNISTIKHFLMKIAQKSKMTNPRRTSLRPGIIEARARWLRDTAVEGQCAKGSYPTRTQQRAVGARMTTVHWHINMVCCYYADSSHALTSGRRTQAESGVDERGLPATRQTWAVLTVLFLSMRAPQALGCSAPACFARGPTFLHSQQIIFF